MRIILVVGRGSVIGGTYKAALCGELIVKPFIVDIDAQRAAVRLEIGPIDEPADTFMRVKHRVMHPGGWLQASCGTGDTGRGPVDPTITN